MSDLEFMEMALTQAQLAAAAGEVPIGAVLAAEGRVLGLGYNLRETTGRTLAHAELLALERYNQASGQWRCPPGTTLYVTVEPCMMCVGALLWARVERLVYGCEDPKNAGFRKIDPWIAAGVFDHRFTAWEGGVLAEKSRELLQSFFRERRKKPENFEGAIR